MGISESSILITGGTGSIGKELSKLLLNKFHPERIIIFSRDELKQHDMQKNGFDHPSFRFFIGDVRDEKRLRRAFRGVDIVIHAAALKQVPSCEYNPLEAVKTNITGAENIIEAAIDTGVKKVIALSTDKAVNPVNLYGATKLVAEKLFVQANAYSGGDGTKFSCVRYGNVIGSRGSVVPIFIEQAKTGVVTITDDQMTRFWITQNAAANFIIECLYAMRGGEVFVPKIPSMRIADMAKAIAPDAEQRVSGIRPGEKLHEVLISTDDARHTVELDNMFIIRPASSWWNIDRWNTYQWEALSGDFCYTSDNNPHWLTQVELVGLVNDSFAPLVDKLQHVLDEAHVCSEVHMVLEKKELS